jgi:hypothetical protein
VALSGTAYAVTRLPANSVGTKQVINHSLQGVDFKRGTLLRGPVGQPGPKGASGPQGVAGTIGTISYRSKSGPISATTGTDTRINTSCPEGTIMVSGGWVASAPVYVMSAYSLSNDYWVTVRSTGVAGVLALYSKCGSK